MRAVWERDTDPRGKTTERRITAASSAGRITPALEIKA